jgi:RNA polymerase sigma-70 factor (ECF subfamily)
VTDGDPHVTTPHEADVVAAVELAFRRDAGPVLSTLARSIGDVWIAADAVQEAFLAALRTWPKDGQPDNPGAWILTTARNRAIDQLRRETRRPVVEGVVAANAARATTSEPELADLQPVADDQLRLLFMCCHPVLAPEAQVVLALRLVCGLRTPEIARVFLVPTGTIAQRIVRAKRKIRAAQIELVPPPDHLLPERTPYVLASIYLLFTEGYAAGSGDAVVRGELCTEAIRLARLVASLMPDEPEAVGLLALLLLQDSRRSTRFDAGGAVVLMEDQPRAQWDHTLIAEGVRLLEGAMRRGRPGPYQLQAAIAALHAEAPTWASTDWPQIAALYAELVRLHPSPVVELNRAVAVAMVAGPAAGLALVDSLDDLRLGRSHLFHATRGDLLRRMGRRTDAAAAYAQAVLLAGTQPERQFLRRRIAECREDEPARG